MVNSMVAAVNQSMYSIGHERDWIWRGWQIRYTYQHSETGDPASVPMLLLHGFGAAIGHWRHNLPVFAQARSVYALDLLGFGASEKVVTNYTIDLRVAMIHDFWRTLIRRPVIMVGNSLGSLVCLGCAAAHPEMVAGITFLNLPDSSVLADLVPAPLRPVGTLLGIVTQPIINLAKGFLTFPLWFNPFFNWLRQPQVLKPWAQKAYQHPDIVTNELVEVFARPAYDRGAARALAAMVHSDRGSANLIARAALPPLQIPLLLIWGQQDQMVPVKLAPLLARYNPNLRLEVLDQVGHCPHDEAPEQVNALIGHWLDRHVQFHHL